MECKVIDWISKGVIPKMSEEEKIQVNEDLEKINLDRDIDLDLSMTFQDHFKKLEIPTSSSGSDISSDSDSDSSTDSDKPAETNKPAETEEENFLENHLAF